MDVATFKEIMRSSPLAFPVKALPISKSGILFSRVVGKQIIAWGTGRVTIGDALDWQGVSRQYVRLGTFTRCLAALHASTGVLTTHGPVYLDG